MTNPRGLGKKKQEEEKNFGEMAKLIHNFLQPFYRAFMYVLMIPPRLLYLNLSGFL